MAGLLKQNSFRAWLMAFRVKTLGAMICPIFLGGALAFSDGRFNDKLFLVSLLAGVLLQVLANLANDYGDFLRGADRDRLGPARVMALGLISEKHMQMGLLLNICLILVTGCYLCYVGGWLIFVVGTLGFICAIWYSYGKHPLAFFGLSELIVFFLFGFIPTVMTYYLQTLKFSFDAFILGMIPGFLASALMLTNNVRDIKEDELSLKKTLAVRLGFKKSFVLIFLFVSLSLSSLLLSIFIFDYNLLLLVLIWPFMEIFYKLFLGRLNALLFSIGRGLFIVAIILPLGIIYERLSQVSI